MNLIEDEAPSYMPRDRFGRVEAVSTIGGSSLPNNQDCISRNGAMNWDEQRISPQNRTTIAESFKYHSFIKLEKDLKQIGEFLKSKDIEIGTCADGVGGGSFGEFASRIATIAFYQNITDALQKGYPLSASLIKQATQYANQLLIGINRQNSGQEMFTTFRCACKAKNKTFIYGVGDTNAIAFQINQGQITDPRLIQGNEDWSDSDGSTGPWVLGDAGTTEVLDQLTPIETTLAYNEVLVVGTNGFLENVRDRRTDSITYMLSANIKGYANTHIDKETVTVGELMTYVASLNRSGQSGTKRDNRSAFWFAPDLTIRLPYRPKPQRSVSRHQTQRSPTSSNPPNRLKGDLLRIGAVAAVGATLIAVFNGTHDPYQTSRIPPTPTPIVQQKPTETSDYRLRITPPVNPTDTPPPKSVSGARPSPTPTPLSQSTEEASVKQPTQPTTVADQEKITLTKRYRFDATNDNATLFSITNQGTVIDGISLKDATAINQAQAKGQSVLLFASPDANGHLIFTGFQIVKTNQ